jgi:hypothetical protein
MIHLPYLLVGETKELNSPHDLISAWHATKVCHVKVTGTCCLYEYCIKCKQHKKFKVLHSLLVLCALFYPEYILYTL